MMFWFEKKISELYVDHFFQKSYFSLPPASFCAFLFFLPRSFPFCVLLLVTCAADKRGRPPRLFFYPFRLTFLSSAQYWRGSHLFLLCDKMRRKITDKQLVALWKDPKFSGSYSGTSTFAAALKIHKKIDVPLKRLKKVLHSIPTFVQQSLRVSKVGHRNLDFPLSVNMEMQCDLMELPADVNPKRKVFLVVCDLCSLYCWVSILDSKKAEDVQSGFDDIFHQNGDNYPVSISSDRGQEFLAKTTQLYFARKKIFFSARTLGASKAFMVEAMIRLIKKYVFLLLAEKLSNDAIRELPEALAILNNRTSESLANLSPAAIQYGNFFGQPQLRDILQRVRGKKEPPPTIEEGEQNQAKYLASADGLKPGDIVALPYAKAQMRKSSLPTVRKRRKKATRVFFSPLRLIPQRRLSLSCLQASASDARLALCLTGNDSSAMAWLPYRPASLLIGVVIDRRWCNPMPTERRGDVS